jgi:Glycosyltransferase family 87
MTNLIADARRHPVLFSIGALGVLASLVLLLCSTGTNDIRTWESFASDIQEIGLSALYAKTPQFNHPPLMGILAWLSLEFSSLTGLSFAIVFKLFPFLANVGSALVLWALWKHREGSGRGAQAFALFSWALCPMFVASYHGNTDSACAFFCLLGVFFLEVRKQPFLGGIAIAVAINVKIIPLLIVVPALAGCRSLRDARAFALGSATAAIPFLFALMGAGSALVSNVFGYGSSPEFWGVQVLLISFRTIPGLSVEELGALSKWYYTHGKYVLVAAVLLLSAVGFWRKLSHARLIAAALALFLVLTPGFGVQYTAYPAPLLFAVSLAWGTNFALLAGIFIGLVYASWSLDIFPLESNYTGYDSSLAFFGFGTWLAVLAFIPTCFRRDTVPPSVTEQETQSR